LLAEYHLPLLAKTDAHPAAWSLCDCWSTCSIRERCFRGRFYRIPPYYTFVLAST